MVLSEPAFDTVGMASTVIVTVSREGGQEPLVMVQMKRLAPTPRPVTAVFGKVAPLMVPLPDSSVHKPEPVTGVLPKSESAEMHMVLLTPALAWVGGASTLIRTVSREGGQVPLTIVHTNVFVPMPRPDTEEVGELTELMKPDPETSVQVPEPLVGVLPLKVVELEQMV